MDREISKGSRTVAVASGSKCAFCAIARGEDESIDVICEAEDWLAFFPRNPATPGHTLVIPRSHVRELWEVEPPLDCTLMRAVIKVGKAITSAMQPEGMNVITSAGKAAEQSVFHLHLHVVPRWDRDGFGRIWPVGLKFEDKSIVDIASRIRAEC